MVAVLKMAVLVQSPWFRDPAVIREEQGIVGVAVPAASEEAHLLLQVVPLPERQGVELLDGHPEDTEELLLGQVSLEGGDTDTSKDTFRIRDT